jgi:uncharacterized protein YkwD
MIPRVALLVAVLALAGAAFPASAEITRSSLLVEINRVRTEEGLAPLVGDERLDRAAETRMRDMEELGYWGHRSPEGRSPFEALRLNGFAFRSAGENLARGFETPLMLVLGWLESPGHRRNLLSADFAAIGIAVIDGAPTARADGHSVVALFAREAERPLSRPKSTIHPRSETPGQ